MEATMVTTGVAVLACLFLSVWSEPRPTEFLPGIETFHDLFTQIALGDLDIILGIGIRVHQVKETVIDVDLRILSAPTSSKKNRPITMRAYQGILGAFNVRNIHVVGRRREILELLAGEDIDRDKVDLGVTVLASLGCRHVDDLARAALDHDVAVLPQGRALHRVGEGGTGFTGGILLERMILYILN